MARSEGTPCSWNVSFPGLKQTLCIWNEGSGLRAVLCWFKSCVSRDKGSRMKQPQTGLNVWSEQAHITHLWDLRYDLLAQNAFKQDGTDLWRQGLSAAISHLSSAEPPCSEAVYLNIHRGKNKPLCLSPFDLWPLETTEWRIAVVVQLGLFSCPDANIQQTLPWKIIKEINSSVCHEVNKLSYKKFCLLDLPANYCTCPLKVQKSRLLSPRKKTQAICTVHNLIMQPNRMLPQ